TFVQRQQLIQAQDQLYRVIWQTQQQAIAQRTPWQASFRSAPAGVEWARHPSHRVPSPSAWQSLQGHRQISIDAGASTLRQQADHYAVQFDHQGYVSGQLGRLTLVTPARLQRCVVVSTRLGALRKGQGNAQRTCG
ncbi:MAG: prepilin-type cleavage/methylation domain-containing protein, partial [Cyanobacteria bacterium P01_A01_bin.135]